MDPRKSRVTPQLYTGEPERSRREFRSAGESSPIFLKFDEWRERGETRREFRERRRQNPVFFFSRYSTQGRLRAAFVGRSRCFEVEGNQAIPVVDFTNRRWGRPPSQFVSFFLSFLSFQYRRGFYADLSPAFFLPSVSSSTSVRV